MLAVLLWVLVRGGRNLAPGRWLALAVRASPRWQKALLVLLVFVLVWPTPKKGESASFSEIYLLLFRLQELFATLVVALFILVLRDHSKRIRSNFTVLDPPVIAAGAVLFATSVNPNTDTWLSVVPLPLISAWLVARYWLLRRSSTQPNAAGGFMTDRDERRAQIARALSSTKARTGMRSAERALQKKLSDRELSPAEYESKLRAYKIHYADRIVDQPSSRAVELLPFAISDDPPWETGCRFVRIGALLAVVPLAMTLYQYLPSREIAYPYPALELATLLVNSICSWLIIAFFFGYYFNEIRGTNGLTKGFALSASLLLPSIVLPLLNTTPLATVQPLLIWGTQVVAFSTLLGGIEDYRTLREADFSLRDLVTLHELPGLSVYASSILAAVASGVAGILSGKLGEVAKLFIDTLGKGPGPAGH
jgi:hypothetical protein